MGGDEKNLWLQDTPSKGEGGSAGGSGIDVRPDGLARFGNQAEEEATALGSNVGNGVDRLRMASTRIGNTFHEAFYFDQLHTRGVARLHMFTQEAEMGVRALGDGAKSIGNTYVNGDATSAATMKDVQRAFTAVRGEGGASGQSTAGSASAGGQENGASTLPPAEREVVADLRKEGQEGESNSNTRREDQTIDLGKDATYTVPAPAPNDLERYRDEQPDLPKHD